MMTAVIGQASTSHQPLGAASSSSYWHIQVRLVSLEETTADSRSLLPEQRGRRGRRRWRRRSETQFFLLRTSSVTRAATVLFNNEKIKTADRQHSRHLINTQNRQNTFQMHVCSKSTHSTLKKHSTLSTHNKHSTYSTQSTHNKHSTHSKHCTHSK